MNGLLSRSKSPLAALLSTVIGIAGGCGDTKASREAGRSGSRLAAHAVGLPPHPKQEARKTDGDRDADNNDDDGDVRGFGRVARKQDEQSISTLVKRYYAATAKPDAGEACSLLDGIVAESLSSDVTGQTGASLKGCASQATKLFEYAAGRSDVGAGSVDVVRVRVKSGKALAIVRLPSGEERYMPVTREKGGWKIAALFDSGMI